MPYARPGSRRALLSSVVASLVVACGGGPAEAPSTSPNPDAEAPDAAPADGGPDLGVSCSGASPRFASDVQPIMQRSCSGGEECHGGFGGGGFTYATLVNAPATRDTCPSAGDLVVPGSLPRSYLMRKLTGIDMCSGTERMPYAAPALAPSELQTIADWICAGAQR